MVLFSRITCYVVIFQLFVLSSLPAAVSLGYTGKFTKVLDSSDSLYDHKVIPENQDTKAKNEIILKWEEEVEDEDHLSDFFNSFNSINSVVYSGISDVPEHNYHFHAYKGIALFILFHCWKTDSLRF